MQVVGGRGVRGQHGLQAPEVPLGVRLRQQLPQPPALRDSRQEVGDTVHTRLVGELLVVIRKAQKEGIYLINEITVTYPSELMPLTYI